MIRAAPRRRNEGPASAVAPLATASSLTNATPLRFEILPQPTETTCGPTCLHAVYRHHGLDVPLDEIIRGLPGVEREGTLGVLLATDALKRGFRATIISYNLQLFDPSWFVPGVDLAAKLEARLAVKNDPRLQASGRAYIDYLRLGGIVRWEELNPWLLRRYLEQGQPILTGLSATYLYDCPRERDDRDDDIAGDPVGHFVVLAADDPVSGEVIVADPLHDNPRYSSSYYRVGIHRLLGAILLGIVTYDANILVIEPGQETDR